MAATPGLMLLGSAAAAYQVPRMLEHPPRPWLLAALCTAALLAAVPFVAMQISGGLTDARFPTPGGRMALTNSIAAAVVVLTWWRPAAFVGGR